MNGQRKLPEHIAIILDGNGRWAAKQGQKRSFGHCAGAKVVFRIAEAAARLHIPYLTVYALSIENWKRPKEEIDYLMELFRNSIDEQTIFRNRIRFHVLGKTDTLPSDLAKYLSELEKRTAEATGMVFTICISYSSKWEITEAVKALYRHVTAAELSIDAISDKDIADFMPSRLLPDPDLIIRSGGEKRLSNFMLWQASYSELYFTETLWPDFTPEDLNKAVRFYQSRDRRYGNIK